jgi:FemAB-related protein (PEP-CTERM system-associated)
MLATATCQQTGFTIQRQPNQAPDGWNEYLTRWGYDGFHLRSEWAQIFSSALQHRPWFIWAEQNGQVAGVLPLMYISGPLFGRFLVSQPYLNTGGILADSGEIAQRLIDSAVSLADDLDVKHLELRHEKQLDHDSLNATNREKVHMRLALPSTTEELWDGLKSKVRSQIRKPLNDSSLTAAFGHHDQLDVFYDIFCQNMRDLGTPPFSKKLFGGMLDQFGPAAEICTIRLDGQPAAAGFLLHAPQVTFIPSASSLRQFNRSACNMLLYWHCLEKAVQQGQQTFDFGRSSVDSGTHRFKKQWGAEEHPAVWQYYSRQGDIADARPNSGKYDRMIATWQKLPVWLTRLIGPSIVRGIP